MSKRIGKPITPEEARRMAFATLERAEYERAEAAERDAHDSEAVADAIAAKDAELAKVVGALEGLLYHGEEIELFARSRGCWRDYKKRLAAARAALKQIEEEK